MRQVRSQLLWVLLPLLTVASLQAETEFLLQLAKLPNGDTSTRKRIAGIELQLGGELHITGTANGGDNASLDYVEIKKRAQ